MSVFKDLKKNYQKMHFKKMLFFFSHFIFLILFLTITCCIIYSNIIIKKQTQKYESAMTSSANTLQSNLTMLQNMSCFMVNSLTYENRVLLRNPDVSAIINHYDIIRLRNNLSALKNIHPAVKRIVLYAPSPQLIITDSSLYHEEEYYYLFPEYQVSDLQARKKQTSLDYFSAVSGNDLTLSVSCLDFHGINAILLFSLDNGYLTHILQPDTSDLSSIIITNPYGTIFFNNRLEFMEETSFIESLAQFRQTASNSTIKINGQNMRVYKKSLDYFNWEIYRFVPASQFFKPVYQFISIFLLGDLILLGLCFWFVLYSTNILYQPISQMVKLVKSNDAEEAPEEFNLISNHFSALKIERNKLQNQLLNFSESAQINILRRLLLYGESFFSEEDIPNMLDEANISMPHPFYFIAILNFYYKPLFYKDFTQNDQQMLFKELPDLIKYALNQKFENNWMLDLEQFRYAIIINSKDEHSDTKIKDMIYSFLKLIKEDDIYMSFSFAVSGGNRSFKSMISTFKIINEQSRHYRLGCSNPQICAETCNFIKKCTFPEKLEDNIRSTLVNGNHTMLAQIIDSVFNKNLGINTTPYHLSKVNNMFFELYENLAGITQPQNNPYRSHLYLHLYDINDNCHFITEMFFSLFNNEKIQQNANRNEFLQYIDKNYKDPNLDLQQMADYFHFNINYLSRLFKKQTGINFSEYLTNIRIKEAINIIENSEISIDNVAQEVGIVNRRSFNRIFKKETGLSPAMYKLLHKE